MRIPQPVPASCPPPCAACRLRKTAAFTAVSSDELAFIESFRSSTLTRQADITGMLVFDGQHFCQQLEGCAREVNEAMARIQCDPRHRGVEVVHHGPLDKRRFSRFSLGYTSGEDIELLERLQRLKGQAAVDAFVALLSGLDVDG